MKTKPTPGPWQYDGKYMVTIPHAKGSTSFRTMPEDARLIVAAPELLEWAKAYLVLLEGLAVSPNQNLRDKFFAASTLSTMIQELKRTIAQATGGA